MRAAFYILIGAVVASGVWYWAGPYIDQSFWMKHAIAQDYEKQVKAAVADYRKGDMAKALAEFNAANAVMQTHEAQVGHPELSNCQTHPGKDKAGQSILIAEPCPYGVSSAVYIGKGAVIHIQYLTYTEELPLGTTPNLSWDKQIAGEATPLGGNRFKVNGIVFDKQKIPTGYKIRVTVE